VLVKCNTTIVQYCARAVCYCVYLSCLFSDLNVPVHFVFHAQAVALVRTEQEATKRPSKSDSLCSII
jgi:hypothetical protein